MLNFNPKNMEKMLKQFGVKTEKLNPEEVRVKLADKEMVFHNPDLTKMDVKGQEMFQLQGDYKTEETGSEEDLELIMEKTGASEEEAEKALEESDDITEAIMSLKS